MYQIGDVINHTTFGIGKVVRIEERKDGRPLVFVQFEGCADPKRFTDVSLSKHLVK